MPGLPEEQEPALDFSPRELDALRDLVDNGVRFMITGGSAVRFHGHLRTAEDIDVWVSNDTDNARRLCAAISEIIGHGQPIIPLTEITGRNRKISLEPHGLDLDILTGDKHRVTFEDAFARCCRTTLDTLTLPVISKADLIAVKLEAGRQIDLEDVQALQD